MANELQALLAQLGVHPNKALGQNFLTDPDIARAIVADLRAAPEDTVIEVGPGTGALTEHLVGRVARLILVEFDKKLAAHLSERYADVPGVEVLQQDASLLDLRPLFADGPVKAIGNLPYSCGGAILRRFLDPPTPLAGAVFMLQKEVAQRLQSPPRTKEYGVLTLMVGARWEVETTRVLPPEPFYPEPAVDSTVLRLTPRAASDMPPFDWGIFQRLVKLGFAQRRKQLGRRLPLEAGEWAQLCAQLGLSETARAEELSREDWIALTRAVDPHPLKDTPQSADELFDVVDDEDAVIGQAPRAQVHAEGLKHRAVHVFVFNRGGELFLQKRSMLKDIAPGKWDSSAAGHLDVGEEYAACALRELAEELGISAEVEEIAAIPAREATGWEFVRLFKAEHRGRLRWPASEIETGAFFSRELIEDWIARRPQDFASGFLECWRRWASR